MNSITNLEGTTYSVGMRVRHLDGWSGTVTAISGDNLMVQPDDVSEVKYRCWPLNPQAAARLGYPEFCEARDHGQSMGCFTPEARRVTTRQREG